jgi:beta-galactosidase
VEIATTGEPAAMSLAADRDTLRADRRDVAQVTLKVLDGHGRTHPEADNEIAFTVQGEGRLIGVDNGNLADFFDFKANRIQAFHGLCLALVHATGRAGEIRIQASAAGFEPASLTIATRT